MVEVGEENHENTARTLPLRSRKKSAEAIATSRGGSVGGGAEGFETRRQKGEDRGAQRPGEGYGNGRGSLIQGPVASLD